MRLIIWQNKNTSTFEHTHLTIELVDFRASVNASVNHEVRDPRHCRDDTKVLKFETHIEVEGIYLYPEERADEKTQLTIYGSNSGHRDFALMLDDCHVRNDDGSLPDRKWRCKEVSV